MIRSRPRHLPLLPLLKTYIAGGPPSAADLGKLPGLGPRFAAVLSATARFLYPAFLDEASDADLCDALTRFYEAVVAPPLHADALGRHIGVVRHGLNCLLHGRDPLPVRFEACVAAPGTYHVAGLGPVFWSALFQAAQRTRRPGWTPAILAGVRRLGLARWQAADEPGFVYAALLTEYQNIQTLAPTMTALHIDHFLTLVGSMQARDLWQSAGDPRPIAAAVQQVRRRLPLRQRLKEQGAAMERARQRLEAGLAQNDGAEIVAALADADPVAGRCQLHGPAHGETLTLWVGRLWETDDPYPLLAKVLGGRSAARRRAVAADGRLASTRSASVPALERRDATGICPVG